jgi:large subunit ribosomal protein L3
MSIKLIGRKKAMVQVFNKKGQTVACTIIKSEPNYVIQVKNEEVDGYNAIQLGSEKIKKVKNVKKPLKGHFEKAKVEPCKFLLESRVEKSNEYKVGDAVSIDLKEGDFLNFIGTSKGKGYQGVMKKYGFSGGPAAHGSGFHRHAGSTGMRSTPGRCLPGGKRASRMGGVRVTAENLEVIEVDESKGIILVKGAVPGNNGSLVYFTKSKKKQKQTKKHK